MPLNLGVGVPQIRSQVGISQQQRIPSGGRGLTAQQLMQAQQAQAARQLAAAQAQANGISGVGMGGLAVGVNGGMQMPAQHHLQPPYPTRTQSASPGHINVQAAQQGQVGPPQGSPLSRPASAVNVGASGVPAAPQNAAGQMQLPQLLQQQQHNISMFYQLVQSGQQIPPEQIQQALRLQTMINVSDGSLSHSHLSLLAEPSLTTCYFCRLRAEGIRSCQLNTQQLFRHNRLNCSS